jgi:hypothetical protein
MQFASGMKDSSKEGTGGAKSLFCPGGGLCSNEPSKRIRPIRLLKFSSLVGRILGMLRASSAQILEFKKILGAIIIVSLPLEMTRITAL